MGAQVVGVDLSDKAIEAANDLANELNIPATFICCNIYDLPAHLNQQFDIVFTSYGTVTWLPDLDKWAGVVNQFLKPSGRFVFAEFHPVVWMFDGDFEKVGYNYFNSGPIIEMEVGTYADRDAPIEMESVGWNHSMMEVVNSLLNQGLQLKALNEYNYSPYNCFKHTTTDEQGNYYIKHLGKNIPMVYSLDMFKSR
jgi:ubiquinone/menaquinone biosynthesis C-methylase UbiE